MKCKKIISLLLSVLMLTALCVPASAIENAPEIIDCGDGYYLVVNSVRQISNTRASSITTEKDATVYNNSTAIGVVTLRGTFEYNGSRATAISGSTSGSGKNGWSYSSGYASCSSNTVTGNYNFKSSSGTNKSFTMKMTCSPNGSVS